MKKALLTLPLLLTSLLAESISQNDLNNIYKEAILFVSVFGIMGIISYIYSKKHAKEYKPKEEDIQKEEPSPIEQRVAHLYALCEKNVISTKEFEVLKKYYLK